MIDRIAIDELGILKPGARAVFLGVPADELVALAAHARRALGATAGSGGQAQLIAKERGDAIGGTLTLISIERDVEGVGFEGRNEGERRRPARRTLGAQWRKAGVGGNDLARRGIDPLYELVTTQGRGSRGGGTAHTLDGERPAERRARPARDHVVEVIIVDEVDVVIIDRDPRDAGHALGHGVGNGTTPPATGAAVNSILVSSSAHIA